VPEPTHGFDAFWKFALGRWDHAPARNRLLHWQDAHAVDVILALFALWYPGGMPASDWKWLARDAAAWRVQTTERVRLLRRRLKPTASEPHRQALYGATKELEIACERTNALRLYQQALHLGHPDSNPDVPRRIRLLFPALPAAEIRDGLPDLIRRHEPGGCT
jgi:uncharacterized protein (TIGR02444 family)